MNQNARIFGWVGMASRISLLIVTLGLAIFCTGCVHMYVDPQYRSATFKDIKGSDNPPLVELHVETQFNGRPQPGGEDQLRQSVAKFLDKSRVFAALVTTNTPGVGKLEITLNDTGSLGGAFAKGFITGLTYGIIGSEIEDHLKMAATYTPAGGSPFTGHYEHSLRSTIGLHSAPAGMERVPMASAGDVVIADMMLNFIRDWQKQELAISPAAPK